MNPQKLEEIYQFIEHTKGYPPGSVFIPECFREARTLVLYRLDPKKGSQRMDKVPLDANGYKCNAHAPSNWLTLEEAYNAWQKCLKLRKRVDGIGVDFHDTGLVGIDVDHCLDEAEIPSETAEEFINALDDQYAEISISGTGLHIFAKGYISADGRKNEEKDVEFYKHVRFIACTWRVYGGHKNEPSDAADRVLQLFEKYISKYDAEEINTKEPYSRPEKNWLADKLSDDQLLEMARHSPGSEKFIKLFDEGACSDYDSDTSRADQALCEMLAYWTDRNYERIEKLFTQSALGRRTKWTREDYRIRTINTACGFCKESYTEVIERRAAEALADFDQLGARLQSCSAGVPAMLAVLREIDPVENKKYRYVSDITLSQLFSAVIHTVARYNIDEKRWYLFDGIRWQPDGRDGTTVARMAIDFQMALKLYVSTCGEINEGYKKEVQKLDRLSRRKSLKEDAQAMLIVRSAAFDSRPELFNCKNGVFNTETEQFQPGHDPDLLITKCSNVVYNPDTESEEWRKTITDILSKNPDCVEYLQKLTGAALTENKSNEEFYICYGAKTRNGKSTFAEVVGYMFGDYGAAASPETLMSHSKNPSRAEPDVARLTGCRFLRCSEPAKDSVFDVAALKNFTGGEERPTRKLYGEIFQFQPVFRLFICTNYLPAVNDMTLFDSRRVKVIPFNNVYTEDTEDHNLKNRLKSEAVISELFNWCIDGLRMYKQDPALRPPQSVREATEEYRRISDKIQLFVNDELEKDSKTAISVKDVYEAYRDWCRSNGFGVESKKNFTAAIKRRELWAHSATIHGRTVRNVINGYKLISTFDEN